MAADGHPIALTAKLRALSYLSHPMAAFGHKLTFRSKGYSRQASAHFDGSPAYLTPREWLGQYAQG
jgi:hypothetical protein